MDLPIIFIEFPLEMQVPCYRSRVVAGLRHGMGSSSLANGAALKNDKGCWPATADSPATFVFFAPVFGKKTKGGRQKSIW